MGREACHGGKKVRKQRTIGRTSLPQFVGMTTVRPWWGLPRVFLFGFLWQLFC